MDPDLKIAVKTARKNFETVRSLLVNHSMKLRSEDSIRLNTEYRFFESTQNDRLLMVLGAVVDDQPEYALSLAKSVATDTTSACDWLRKELQKLGVTLDEKGH